MNFIRSLIRANFYLSNSFEIPFTILTFGDLLGKVELDNICKMSAQHEYLPTEAARPKKTGT